MTTPESAHTPLPTDVPTPARMYDYALGGKDNFAIDRAAVLELNDRYPEGLAVARENRLFLYRLVRYLARDAGIARYLDMGSGLPTQRNVHEVAREFQPQTQVAYVDNDPIVLAHGRALLTSTPGTTVITADMTETAAVLDHPAVRELLDAGQPVAALFLSITHSIPDDDTARAMFATVAGALPAGSYLAMTQMSGEDRAVARQHTEAACATGLDWKTRAVQDVPDLVAGLGLEPVDPGWVDVNDWRPDPDQPPLAPVDEPLRKHLRMAAASGDRRVIEYGALLHKR